MTDVTLNGSQAGAELSAADEQLLRELTERARAGGLKLTGEGGLLGKLTKMVVEGALEGERPAIGNLVVSATQTNKSSARQTRLLNGPRWTIGRPETIETNCRIWIPNGFLGFGESGRAYHP